VNYYNHQRNILQTGHTATVSVITCTYNRAPYLDRCINSVLQQSIRKWELIIVDDGSSDNTFEVVDKYLTRYGNIRYIKQTNAGQGLARNAGIAIATGEYITFLDSDDAYAPEHLQTRIDFMKSNPEIDLIHGGILFNDDIDVADYYVKGNLINLKECIISGGLFGKSHLFYKLGGFKNQRYGEDTDLWERAKAKYKTFKITEPETYIYTRAGVSASRENTDSI
jgi:glycosyltransferase involved in cell wall biosynthesis